jgi:hypothetical protein
MSTLCSSCQVGTFRPWGIDRPRVNGSQWVGPHEVKLPSLAPLDTTTPSEREELRAFLSRILREAKELESSYED